ncbi:AbrB/MazE/SpoVT family DNA-binding domain-containing protein [Bacillus tropicus]|uniref:AbrB/MazE/SpoVT family DNA-binding domain-containing protein n=1 Tax=Bacillus tropicus TaxID=2026188 RepID=A0ABD7ZYR4_9BACI|nr:AbrB/MazE/SpoVT family DNA-binding domain-containing protein [Bacillus tropicus]MCU5425637.1 AbrB/MazE/SpoVT family DNA-binding domain-containing protein [Bacillus tropicus]WMY18240.1 AbrB/MazE/SpoVT family DNA-binding domain-containing protein [Bacillus tropicus]
MKNTGIVRKIDELGRIVIPKEMRNTLGLPTGSPIEFHVNGESIVLKKHENVCAVTGKVSDNNLELFGGQVVVSKDGAKVLLDSLTREAQRRGWVS